MNCRYPLPFSVIGVSEHANQSLFVVGTLTSVDGRVHQTKITHPVVSLSVHPFRKDGAARVHTKEISLPSW